MTSLSRASVQQFLAAAAARDPERRVFGAADHGWSLGPALPPARLQAIERALGFTLPADYRAFVTQVAAWGAGPGYGLVPLDDEAQVSDAARAAFVMPETATIVLKDGGKVVGRSNFTPHQEGLILLADHGCSKLSLLVVNGDDVGAVYLDLRSIDLGFQRAFPSFKAWYAAWMEGVAAGEAPPQLGPPESCAPPNALSNYLEQVAKQLHGDAKAALSDAEITDALQGIGAGGIATNVEGDRFFAPQAVRLCSSCLDLIGGHVARGQMRPDVLAPSEPTLPEARGRNRGGGAGPAASGSAGVAPGSGAAGPTGAGPTSLAHAPLLPGSPVPTLADYAALMKEAQRGDLIGALSRRSLDFGSYGAIASQWGQLIASRPELGTELGRLMAQ